jgi:excinuclease UvrABC nuclease subunit
MSSSLVNSPEKLTERLGEIPTEPGVYFMRDSQGLNLTQ